MKYFWLIRHAKTAWPEPGQADAERELKKRGHRDGARLADYFRNHVAPANRADWIVCSSALRTQQTARYVAAGFGVANTHVVSERALYLADPHTLLDALRETPADAQCVAVVAHNPGMTWLVNQLAGDALELENLPTMGCALFSADITDWTDVREVELLEFITPKLLAQQTE